MIIFYVVNLLVYPIAILFDSSNTKVLTLSISREGMPRENYKWFLFFPGTNWPFVTDIAIDPKQSNNIYAATDKGILKSTDNGNSWQIKSRGLPYKTYVTVRKEIEKIDRLKFDPNDPTKIYAEIRNFEGTKEQSLHYVSSDGGDSWEQTKKNIFPKIPDQINSNIQQVNEGLAITYDPLNKKTLYKVESKIISMSNDNGTTWKKIYGSKARALMENTGPLFLPALLTYYVFAWVSPSGWLLNYSGIDGTSYFTTPLVFSPQDPNVVFIGISRGVMKGRLNR